MKTKIIRIKEALEKNRSIVLTARCAIIYSGRAEAFLPDGDRFIIIKADRSMVIHQPTGSNPVNHMREGASVSIEQSGKNAILKAAHLANKEYLDIELKKIYSVHDQCLDDGQKQVIAGTEKDMADMLFSNPEIVEKGFRPLSTEEHTKYGFIDVFGYDKDNVLTVVECKRYTAQLNAVQQLRRYVERIRKVRGVDKVRGIIAAPKISSNAEKMLKDWGFRHIVVKPPNYLERFDRKQSKL
ncbi:DUF91 domain-containing protein, partial [Candidatus Woesearchaeota archaeon]|nr:DUF91 domain-containing protein [Candidatus Woesearchaeota archaeon]